MGIAMATRSTHTHVTTYVKAIRLLMLVMATVPTMAPMVVIPVGVRWMVLVMFAVNARPNVRRQHTTILVVLLQWYPAMIPLLQDPLTWFLSPELVVQSSSL